MRSADQTSASSRRAGATGGAGGRAAVAAAAGRGDRCVTPLGGRGGQAAGERLAQAAARRQGRGRRRPRAGPRSNCGARASSSPDASKRAERPSKTSSSWPADLVAERERGGAVVGARGEHPLAPVALAPVVRGGGDAADQVDARRREVGGDGCRVPDVLAHGEADAHAERLDHDRRLAGAEVARLVEDAVVRQEALAVDGLDAPVGHHRGAVVARRRPTRGTRSPRGRGAPPGASRSSASRAAAREARAAAADPPAGSRRSRAPGPG